MNNSLTVNWSTLLEPGRVVVRGRVRARPWMSQLVTQSNSRDWES